MSLYDVQKHADYTIWTRIKQAAKRRGYEFLLSKEQVKDLVSKDCVYCGMAPSKRTSFLTSRMRSVRFNDFIADKYYFANGIDRKDNSIGYVLDNCVPCCTTCNMMKKGMPYDDWISWLDQLVKFRSQQTSTLSG